MDTARLEAIEAFRGLPRSELDELARHAVEATLPTGQDLLAEGDEPWELVAIESGTAEVERGGEALADVGPGDVVGEIGVILGRTRTATVRATSPMSLLLLGDWDLRALARRAPQAVARLRSLADRRMPAAR